MNYPSRTEGINPVRAYRESDFSLCHANIHKIRQETLIMKFPFLYAVCLLLALITVIAGCSSSSSVPGTGTPSSGLAPGTTGTPVLDNELSKLALLPSEIPFVVVDAKSQTPDLRNPAFSKFGALRGFTRFSINEAAVSATSIQLGQTIVEYPPGKAKLALADFENQSRNTDLAQYNITLSTIPGIGEENVLLTVTDKTGAVQPRAMIVFVKSTIMESVTMIGPKPDLDAPDHRSTDRRSKNPLTGSPVSCRVGFAPPLRYFFCILPSFSPAFRITDLSGCAGG